MIKSALGKVMWVGRTTVFVVGLAVILAMVVGVASAAFGANGNNFIIGNGINDTTKNIASLTSRLTMNGTASAPGLQVTQQSTGTGASGVGITVPTGKAPIKVNSAAGKATNLNADKLDGKDSTQFTPTTTYIKSATNPNPAGNGSIQGTGAACDQEPSSGTIVDVLLSGGVKLHDPTKQEVVESRPVDTTAPNQWFGSVKDNTPTATGAGFEVFVLCADLGTPHTG